MERGEARIRIGRSDSLGYGQTGRPIRTRIVNIYKCNISGIGRKWEPSIFLSLSTFFEWRNPNRGHRRQLLRRDLWWVCDRKAVIKRISSNQRVSPFGRSPTIIIVYITAHVYACVSVYECLSVCAYICVVMFSYLPSSCSTGRHLKSCHTI